MFENFFKTGWRNIKKLRFYSIINIFGLSGGIAFTLLIGAYVWNELQVNKSFKNAGNIFILENRWKSDGNNAKPAIGAPERLPGALKEQYPGLVANYYRTLWKNTVVSNGDRYFRENVQIGDSSLINMFGLSLLYGKPNTLFKNPGAVVITAEKAIKFFGTENAIGKILIIENNEGIRQNFIVTGVLKDIPYNSVTTIRGADKLSLNSIFLSYSVLKSFYGETGEQSWATFRNTFIELKKGITPADLTQPVHRIMNSNTADDVKNDLQIDFLPLSTYYLDANNDSVRKMIYTLSFTALLILVMAIVNFINITIGSSMSRLREIGVRKVLGSSKPQLVLQFLCESFIIAFIAVGFSLIIYSFIQPLSINILDKILPPISSFSSYSIVVLFFLGITIGLLAGLYPALVLSSAKAAASVKGKLLSTNENISLRKILVGFQFFIAIVVFVSAIVINKQVNYILNTDLGFNKEQIINIPLPRVWTAAGIQKMQTVRNEITALPKVANASICYSIPNRNSMGSFAIYREGIDSVDAIEIPTFVSDENYAATFDIPIVTSHFFNSGNYQTDSSSVVLNETAVKTLGWNSSQQAVGNKIKIAGENKNYTICGVIKDFHFESKQEKIKPLLFSNIYSWSAYRFISVKLKPGNPGEALASIQKKWSVLLPGEPFDYSFMDETLQLTYSKEIQFKKVSYIATALSLIIVLLGIVGMVSLSIAKRTKEIGIRKVLGASVGSIISLFLKEVFLIILFCSFAAIPFSYIVINLWLNNYAYRIQVGSMPFIIVSAAIVFLTGSLICIQTIKAAIANPVKSLKAE